MNLQLIVGLALKASIMFTVFGYGLQAVPEDLFYILRRPRLLIASLASLFLVMPSFALLMTRCFSFHPAVNIALIALSISPVPPMLPKRENKSGGLAAYALGLMVGAAAFSIVFVPVAAYLMGKYFNRPFAMDPMRVAKLMVVTIFIPLIAGMIFRRLATKVAARVAGPVVRIAGIVLLIGGVCVLTFAAATVWSLVGNGTLLAFVVFCIVGLVAGHLLAGPSVNEQVTLALSTACRHPALAVAIAAANVPEEHRVLSAVLLYLLVSVLVPIPYVAWQRKRMTSLAARS